MRNVGKLLQTFIVATICLLPLSTAFAQGPAWVPPSSIQVFMPNGSMPTRVIRIILVRDDGLTDFVFTDSKGKFDIATPRNRPMNYAVTIEGDKETYNTTTVNLTLDRNIPNRLTVFLKPLTGNKPPVNAVLDVTNFEENVPQAAGRAYKRATESIDAGQLDEGINNLLSAISLYPKYVRALNDLGVLYLRLDRLDEAAKTFRQAIDISKRFFHPRMNLGIVLNRQRKYKEAIEVLGPLYEENNRMLEVRLAYGNALLGADELNKAEEVYRSILSSPSISNLPKATAHFKLGLILSRQGRFADASAELEKSLALNSEAANAHLLLGGALVQLQEPDRAERELLRAYELGGKSAGGAQLLLGQLYYSQKKYAEAQRAFEQYLKDVPSPPNSSQITKLIADLKARRS